MSVLNLRDTFDRVKSAKPESPIAVFSTYDKKLFNSVFASTVNTSGFIQRSKKCDYIGTYHGPYGAAEFKRKAVYLYER